MACGSPRLSAAFCLDYWKKYLLKQFPTVAVTSSHCWHQGKRQISPTPRMESLSIWQAHTEGPKTRLTSSLLIAGPSRKSCALLVGLVCSRFRSRMEVNCFPYKDRLCQLLLFEFMSRLHKPVSGLISVCQRKPWTLLFFMPWFHQAFSQVQLFLSYFRQLRHSVPLTIR